MAPQGVPGQRHGAVRLDRRLTPVGELDRFPPRSVTLVRAGRLELGIVRWDGDAVYALRNRCPHAGGPLCEGRLGPRICASVNDPLRLEVDDASPVLTCAWHGWEFDARDGRALVPGTELRVRTYRATVQDGVVLVDLGTSNSS